MVFGIWIAQVVSPKARRWIAGRCQWRSRVLVPPPERQPVLWMHVASLGEFEQGRPLLEALRRRYPSAWIVLSFFSPSGYEVRKNYVIVDNICYLPADTRRQAHDFIHRIQPDLAVFVKYDFWANHLFALRQRGTPILLVSALFRAGQPFFQPWGGLWRQMLRCFSHIFTQDAASVERLRRIGLSDKASAVGDTRVDRVAQLANEHSALERPLLSVDVVAGSTWPADEELLLSALHHPASSHLCWVIAPHEPSERCVRRLTARIRRSWARYSEWDGQTPVAVMVIDSVGLLARLYRYGRIAYIGGGFGRGIHNTLEPAAYGLPLLFGPKYERFEEARQFVRRGGAFPVRTSEELLERIRQLQQPDAYARASAAVRQFIAENQGATERILQWIEATLAERIPL